MDKNITTNTEIDLDDILKKDTLEEKQYSAIELPKILISQSIKDALKEKSLSLRKVAQVIDELDYDDYKISYTQIARVTSGENYKINTLLKVLDVLDLEITIQPKSSN